MASGRCALRLRDVHPMHRFGPVRSALQSMGEVLKIRLKSLAVVPPCLPVHTRRSLPLQLEVGIPQSVDPVDLMHQSGELHILVRLCCLSYLRQLTWHVYPSLSPDRVLLAQIPSGQTSPSIPSAAGCPALFGDFFGTMSLSDFPCSFIIGSSP